MGLQNTIVVVRVHIAFELEVPGDILGEKWASRQDEQYLW